MGKYEEIKLSIAKKEGKKEAYNEIYELITTQQIDGKTSEEILRELSRKLYNDKFNN